MRHLLKSMIFILLVLSPGLTLLAQSDEGNVEIVNSDDGKGWIFGLNVGVYYPSKNTAAFYNGSPKNENNVNYVMSNYYWYQEIYNVLGAHDTVEVAGLPQNMHYKLAIQPGIYAQYCFSPTLALLIEFNYMRLKANDAISLEVDPKPYATQPDLRLYPIRGSEERVYADIGLKRTYPKDEGLSYFLTGGLNINSTKVKQSSIFIEQKEYSMINLYGSSGYVPNNNMQTYSVYQGGIGVGMFAGGGASLVFGNGIIVEPGITAHWLIVKLNGYTNMNPGIGAYIRFLF